MQYQRILAPNPAKKTGPNLLVVGSKGWAEVAAASDAGQDSYVHRTPLIVGNHQLQASDFADFVVKAKCRPSVCNAIRRKA